MLPNLAPYLQAQFFQCIKNLGFNPTHIVDIGANRGTWTRNALQYFPDAYYSLFEPQAYLTASFTDLLKNPKIKFHAKGVGANSGMMDLTTSERDDSFSFSFTPEQAQARGRKQVKAPVVALDEFLPTLGLPTPDLVKIDAEGWDLEVIKGAENTLRNAQVVLMEAAVMSKSFTNSLAKTIQAMAESGFCVFDITDLNRTQKHNALALVEIAFVKAGGAIDRKIDTYQKGSPPSRILHLCGPC
jgi:FkbM family methyltransferase